MNLVLLDPEEIGDDGCAVLRDRRARHIRTVIRAEPGRTLRVGIVDGARGTAVVDSVRADAVRIRCHLVDPPPGPSGLSLLLALPRPKVLKRLWPTLASLAVDNVILANAARVERCYFDTHWMRAEVYEPLLRSGLEQGGHTAMPRVVVRRRLKPLVEDELDSLCPGAARILAHPGSSAAPRANFEACGRGPVSAPLRRGPRPTPPTGYGNDRAGPPGRPQESHARSPEPVLLAVGPEGGWVPFELDLLKTAGFEAVSLGPYTLRSDVACVALIATVRARQGAAETV